MAESNEKNIVRSTNVPVTVVIANLKRNINIRIASSRACNRDEQLTFHNLILHCGDKGKGLQTSNFQERKEKISTNMSAKYAFSQTLKEVRFLFCQTGAHSDATRYDFLSYSYTLPGYSGRRVSFQPASPCSLLVSLHQGEI